VLALAPDGKLLAVGRGVKRGKPGIGTGKNLARRWDKQAWLAALYTVNASSARVDSMMSDPLGTAIRRLLRRVSPAPSAGLSDAELLERFVRSRDEAAIETLLWRHGPMVLATCRRLMKHHADSEDCFQATFLVLAAGPARSRRVSRWGAGSTRLRTASVFAPVPAGRAGPFRWRSWASFRRPKP
jgi:hypothetical protein